MKRLRELEIFYLKNKKGKTRTFRISPISAEKNGKILISSIELAQSYWYSSKSSIKWISFWAYFLSVA
jgi:hypothetical protein